jgi:DNA-binding transcriptional MerR regulator
VDDQWLTTKELAERLRTVPSTVRYWKHRGYGPPGTRFGRRTLYKLADVIYWETRQQAAQQVPSSNPRPAA